LGGPRAGVEFVVVDLGTTGGASGQDAIIELGAPRVMLGRLTERFASLVRPGRPIQPFVTRLAGITDAMVAGAPRLAEVLPRFVEFVGTAVLVAHNAAFDVGHLRAAGAATDAPALCTIRLARRLLPESRRRSLDAVAATLGIACFRRHRALPDAEMAASLLEARRIRELKPPYNRQLRGLPRVGFLKLGVRSEFPRLWATERVGADRATYLGPFASLAAAERALAVLGRVFKLRTCPGRLHPAPEATPCLSGQVGACTAPCAAHVDEAAYRAQVDACLAFFAGGDERPLDWLGARRDVLAAELRFEAAAQV